MIEQTMFGDVRIESVLVRSGMGVHQLRFNVEFDFRLSPPAPFENPSHVALRGDVSVRSAGASGWFQPIGPTALSGSGIVVLPRAFPYKMREELSVYLAPNQLVDIERTRTGGGLEFQFDLFPVLFCANRVLEMPMIHVGLEVVQSEWVRLLGQLDFQRTLLLEVPLDLDASLEGHLLRARAAFDMGEYRQSVGVCRDVLESLASRRGDAEAVSKESFSDLRNKDKEARLRLLRHALTTLTNPAHHTDEVATAIDWNRTDAEAVLAMTAGVLLMEGRVE